MELQYIGHPFVDVGLTVILAMSDGKYDLHELTADDLEAAALQLKDIYCHYPIVQNYISVIFTNSHFVQAAKSVEQKEAYADEILFLYQQDRLAEPGDRRCAYFPHLAVQEIAFRHHIPLLNGMDIGNFSGRGQAGLPVSGLALLAIHAMPLGCFKVGHLLAFHELINPHGKYAGELMGILAREAYQANRTAISMMPRDRKEGEMPTYGSYPKSRYVDGLIRAALIGRQYDDLSITNITGYYFTNYGPSPGMEILRLDNAVLNFVMLAVQDYPDAWQRATHHNWVRPKKEKDTPITSESTILWKNSLYESLFNLYAVTPFRRFIWMIASGGSWSLIELALRKVLLMDQDRIDTYRELGDRLSDYALRYEPGVEQSFYYKISRATKYTRLRSVLRVAAEKMMRANEEVPLFTYDEFIMAFEHPGDTYFQWRLARDLIAIRMLERLHQNNISMDDLPENEEPEEEED